MKASWDDREGVTHLENDVREVVLVTVQRRKQLEPLPIESEVRVALGKDEVEANVGQRVSRDGDLLGSGVLPHLWKWGCAMLESLVVSFRSKEY